MTTQAHRRKNRIHFSFFSHNILPHEHTLYSLILGDSREFIHNNNNTHTNHHLHWPIHARKGEKRVLGSKGEIKRWEREIELGEKRSTPAIRSRRSSGKQQKSATNPAETTKPATKSQTASDSVRKIPKSIDWTWPVLPDSVEFHRKTREMIEQLCFFMVFCSDWLAHGFVQVVGSYRG